MRGRATKCRKGHPLSGDNLRILHQNGREVHQCRTCRKAYFRQYQRDRILGVSKAKRLNTTFDEAIADRSEMKGECRLWTGAVHTQNGLPLLRFRDKLLLVKRALWIAAHGEIDKDIRVHSKCVNDKLCINVEHMFVRHRSDTADLCDMEASRRGQLVMNLKHRNKSRQEFLLRALKELPAARGVLYRKFGSLDVENILQDTMLSLYLSWEYKKAEPDSMRALVITAATRAAIDEMRHRSVVPMCSLEERIAAHSHAVLHAESGEPDPATYWEDTQEQKRLRTNLHHRILRVPLRARAVLNLKVKGLSQAQISSRLSISENTVERHMAAARRIVFGRKWKEARSVLL